jgi:hypothetical protein
MKFLKEYYSIFIISLGLNIKGIISYCDFISLKVRKQMLIIYKFEYTKFIKRKQDIHTY